MPSSDSNAGVMSAPLINIVVNNVLLHFGPQINRRAGNNRTTLVFSESDKPEQFALALETFFYFQTARTRMSEDNIKRRAIATTSTSTSLPVVPRQ